MGRFVRVCRGAVGERVAFSLWSSSWDGSFSLWSFAGCSRWSGLVLFGESVRGALWAGESVGRAGVRGAIVAMSCLDE